MIKYKLMLTAETQMALGKIRGMYQKLVSKNKKVKFLLPSKL